MEFFATLFIGRIKLPVLLTLAAGVATACAFAEDLVEPSPWQQLVNAVARAYRASATE
jgi:hypothetical protein